MKVLITSGGCKVPIDDVRHIGNFSSGRYGVELARAFNRDNDVLFFREKDSYPFRHDDTIYKDYEDYLNVKNMITGWQPDVIVSAAAISDYIVDKTEGKISSNNEELVITLRRGEKVIKSFKELSPHSFVVGFKLLVGPTDEEKEAAIEKVFNSGVDIVIYNDLLELRKGKTERELHSKYLGPYPPHKFDDPDYLVKYIDYCRSF
jgi:phosphopantothenoylcysteine decarboxylase/phosphopantothenate--cysteine ligase